MAQSPINFTQLLDTFQLFDENKDGSISFEELRSACDKLRIPFDQERLKNVFPQAHPISFDEFCRVVQESNPSSPETYFTETFRAFDKNQDGFISVKEIKKTMKDLGERLTTKQAKEMLKVADADGDGKLSRDEFRILFNELNHFTGLPADTDEAQRTSVSPSSS